MIWKCTALQRTFCSLLLVCGLLIGCTTTSTIPIVPSEVPSPVHTATAVSPTTTPTRMPSPTPPFTVTPIPSPTLIPYYDLDLSQAIRKLGFDTDNNLWVASTAGVYKWHYNPESQVYGIVENRLIHGNRLICSSPRMIRYGLPLLRGIFCNLPAVVG